MRPARLLLAMICTVACGGDPPPPGDPTAPAAGADVGGAPAGAGQGGAGEGDAQPAASSSPLSFEPLDASGDCAGLVPASAPEPVVVRREIAGGACAGGVADGTGAVAVAAALPDGRTSWQVYAPDGAPRGVFTADGALVPTEDGWHALVVTPGAPGAQPTVEHVAFDASGAARSRATVSPDPREATLFRWSLSPDPAGGSVVVVRWTSIFGNHWSGVTAHRFDAAGAPRWPGGVGVSTDDSASEPFFLGAGVSRRGDALVLAQDSAFLDASWLDAEGHGVASADRGERWEPVVGPGLAHVLELVPLLDASLAVRSDGTLRRVFAHRATASAPLPAWLAQRAAWTLRFTRGNAGYAALPPPGQASADCTQRVELLSPGGRLCGRVVLREEGTGCTARAVDQGWDGTLVQQSGRDACTYRWWPRLLGRE